MKYFDVLLSRYLGGCGNSSGGSSDFSTAQVTFINNTASAIHCLIPYAIDDPSGTSSGEMVFDLGTMTITAILYKGKCLIYLPSGTNSIAISGNIESDGDGYYIITGDCTITMTGGEA